ncbi:MAG: flagellar biosynthetic protein FliO [Ruminococcus sp.]|jgi:flagellar biosynthetic protein FliO|nr:flagellar biosynthetic protein FliO [Ruminococcus sp.]
MPDSITVMLALIGVLGIIFVMFWLAARFQKKHGYGGFFTKGTVIKVLEAVSLSPDKQIAAVKAGDAYILIGIAPGGITKICDLKAEDFPPPDETDAPKSLGESFKTVLAEKFGKHK